MLVRVALILLLLSGLFVAGHLGVNLPWDLAATTPAKAPDTSKPSHATATSPAQSALEETTSALSGGEQAAPSAGSVAIDISRISPDGLSVFAGRAEPDTYVTVLENGKPAGTVQADANGEWSLATEHKFASNDPALTYEVSKTPPAALEPPKEAQVAARPAEPAQQSASAVAKEVMRKFENLVSDARKEAQKYEEAKKRDAEEEAQVAEKSEPELKVEPDATSEPQVESKETATAEASPNATSQTAPTAGEKSSDTSSASIATAASNATAPTSSQDVIPVPIMFVYNEATLTSEGERATSLLLEYLTLKHLSAVELTGHADERGTNEYNFDLSRERLEKVSELLRAGGYAGNLKLTPKGKSEPYAGVDRARYSGEALYQLDRRVELRVNH
ncbi:OmpA family protein [Hyphomicrobium sp.]|uniref:OmpA family protein n=1 Tax=Hyphomicrobium sp. TaxID=82 RepID=UPI002E35DDCD|nr:OmpA family protein [Hyphomicrobium sp.]HEX2843512.1 OmpA family protein [Hyphomicrobium sp.]